MSIRRSFIFAALAAGLLFGAATPLSKSLLSSIGPGSLAGLLYLGAAIATFPFAIRESRARKARIRREGILPVVGAIFFGGFLGPLLLMIGLRAAEAASVSIWLNLELAMTAILGLLFFKDHLDAPGAIAVILTLAAGVLATAAEGLSGMVPALLVGAACLCWGMDNHLTALIDDLSPPSVTFLKGLFAGAMNLAVGLASGETLPGPGRWPIIVAALLVGALSYGASIVLYVSAAQGLGATRAQILFSTGPFWGVLLSCLILGESMGPVRIVALALIGLAVGAVNILRHEHGHIHEPTEHIHGHRHDDGHHDHEHAGSDAALVHSHRHVHARIEHDHKHYPDLHHRHDHGGKASLKAERKTTG